MSQDTGLFSVRRPRETLGNINYNSAIPQPASALKRSNSISHIKESQPVPHTTHHARSISSSRMSLAPNRPAQPNFQRSSSGTNLAADFGVGGRPSTIQRNSSTNLFGNTSAIAPSRMSYAPNAVTPAHHNSSNASQSLQRRSSIKSRPSTNGHQSFFVQAPAPATAPRDPRPWRDANYRQKIGNELLDYLTKNNFELEMKRSLTQKSMVSPTQKDFEAIFQWLYRRIDPAYRFMKNIDVEGPFVLKQLHYPYANSFSKSQWGAVGGQNWSTFLGMLHWIMQLAQMMDRYESGDFDDACAEAGVDVSSDRIVFRFLSGAYRAWLEGGEGEDAESELAESDAKLRPYVDVMAADFDQANQQYAEDLRMLEAEHEVLKQRIVEAEANAPDLAKLDKHFRILEDDKQKFEAYNTNVEGKIEKYEGRNKFLAEEISKIEFELAEAENDRQNLQDSVDRQGITVQDIDRMNNERERLHNSLESTNAKLDETKRKAAEKEAETNRALDDLERAIEKYNSLCYQIALIPSTAANAKGQDFELRLTIDASPNFSSSQVGSSQSRHGGSTSDRLLQDSTTGYPPSAILSHDLRSYIRPHLSSLRKEITDTRTAALDADLKNHELLDSIKEAIDDKRAEVETLEHKVRAAEEDFERTKEVTNTQKVSSEAQIEKMEKELGKLRAAVGEGVVGIEQRELSVALEFEQLTLKANTLREELHTEVEKMLNDIIKFKIHIQKSLGDYESFVAQELENEGLGLSGDVVDDGDLALGGGGAGAGSGRVADGLEDGDGDGGRIEVHGKAEVY